GLAQQVPWLDKGADAAIDKWRALRIGGITQCVRPIFLIVRKPRVGRSADVAGGEIGEWRVFAGTAISVTLVASCLATEQVVALLLLRCELCLFREYRVEFGGERRHLG